MPLLKPYIEWPGVVNGEVSLVYTVGHGISPGRAQVTINAQDTPPAMFGDLAFGDGYREIRLRNCMVTDIRDDYSGGGHYQHLTIQDRRWAWRYGAIPGIYNQLDDRGKLVPWTIRSPTELALLCLQEMGETNFQVKLPTGLSSLDIPKINRLLVTGENFPQSLANPETIWEGIPPALALQRLAETYGCRVAWDPVTDMVGIGPLGSGDGLPPGGELVASSSLGVSAKPAPYAVAVVGAPMRHQMRFWLEAVGEEWDGRYVPISQLSYAPKHTKDSSQRVFVDITPYFSGDLTIGVYINGKGSIFTSTGAPDVVAADLISQINAFSIGVTASAVLTRAFTIEGPVGVAFEFDAVGTNINKVKITVDRRAQKKGTVDWSMCHPPFSGTQEAANAGVQATDRLTVDDAIRKAQESVWKCYRIMISKPDWANGTTIRNKLSLPPDIVSQSGMTAANPPVEYLTVPGVNDPKTDSFAGLDPKNKTKPNPQLVRRQQFGLLPTKVEQIVPSPPIAPGLIAGDLRQPSDTYFRALPEYYNGYSRDQEATVTGTFSNSLNAQTCQYVASASPDAHNVFNQRLFMPFQTIPQEQMIKFSSYVYKQKPWSSGYYPAQIILETSATFQHATTSQVRRPQFFMILGGAGPIAWYRHEDVECHLIAVYDSDGKYQYSRQEDFNDGRARAQYYLQAHAAEFQLVQSEHRSWNAIYNVSITGKVQQVSWSIYTGPSGSVNTQAGLNTEFSLNAAPYPARRMAENLPPDEVSKFLNTIAARDLPDNAFVGTKQAKSLGKL